MGAVPDDLSAGLPAEAQQQLEDIFTWFQQNVSKLEEAYSEMGSKFEKVDQELARTNRELCESMEKNVRMEKEVQHSRVLSALGEMAATVAHEIRNPLGGIGGYAGLLARDLDADDPRRALVDKIIQGVSSMNKIVSNLLFYTRKTELRGVSVEMREWLEDVLAYAELEIHKGKKKIEVVKFFPAEELHWPIDPEKFQQVVLNLLMNAIHSMEEGALTLLMKLDTKKRLVIEVRDTGEGIEEDDLHRIFTPFFTTKEQGTGLGLAIVRKLVELHHGQIEVESTLGRGTVFRIVLDP